MEKNAFIVLMGSLPISGCSFDGETVYYITDEEQVHEFMDRINDAVWIFANAKFDMRQLRRYAEIPDRKRLWDVILIEQIQYSGYYDSFSLADLVQTLSGCVYAQGGTI